MFVVEPPDAAFWVGTDDWQKTNKYPSIPENQQVLLYPRIFSAGRWFFLEPPDAAFWAGTDDWQKKG